MTRRLDLETLLVALAKHLDPSDALTAATHIQEWYPKVGRHGQGKWRVVSSFTMDDKPTVGFSVERMDGSTLILFEDQGKAETVANALNAVEEGCVPQVVEMQAGDRVGLPGYAACCRVVCSIV